MNFIYPALLYGLIFVSVPVIIHFLTGLKPKKIKFSGVYFLNEILKKQKQKLTIHQYLILLLRILFIFFLILASARPVPPHEVSFFKKGRKSIVLIIDNSSSMSLSKNGVSLLYKVKLMARKILTTWITPYDDFIIMTTSDPTRVKFFSFISDVKYGLNIIDNIKINYLEFNLLYLLKKAENYLNSSDAENKMILLLTDNQKLNYIDLNGNFINKSMKIKYPVFIYVPHDYSEIKNSAIVGIDFPLTTYFLNEKFQFTVRIKNFSSKRNNLIIKSYINNRSIGERNFVIKPEEEINPLFSTILSSPGIIWGKVEIIDGDDISGDNIFFFVNKIYRNIKIGLWGKISPYVIGAISPEYFLTGKSSSHFKIIKVNASSLSKADVVIASPLAFTTSSINGIRKYIMAGKSIIFLPSSSFPLYEFNKFIVKNKLFPFEITQLKELNEKGAFTFGSIDYSSPLFAPFNSIKPFKKTKIFKFFKLNTKKSSVYSYISAFISDSSPGLVEYTPFPEISNAKIIFFTIPLEKKATDFVSSPSFPPFVHILIKYVTSISWLNRVNSFTAGIYVDDVKRSLNLYNIKPEIITGKIEDGIITHPGIYRFGKEIIAVNQTFKESSVKYIKINELNRIYKNIQFKPIKESDVKYNLKERMFSFSTWKYLVIISILLFLSEFYISNRKQ